MMRLSLRIGSGRSFCKSRYRFSHWIFVTNSCIFAVIFSFTCCLVSLDSDNCSDELQTNWVESHYYHKSIQKPHHVLVWQSTIHLFFAVLPVFATVVLRMHKHVNPTVFRKMNGSGCGLMGTDGWRHLLLTIIVQAVLTLVSGDDAHFRKVVHGWSFSSWKLRCQGKIFF